MSHTTHIVLRDVRCVYPRLFKPEEYMGKSNYSIGLLLPEGSDALRIVKQAVLDAIKGEYGAEKATAMAKRFAGSHTTWPIKAYGEDGDCYMIQPKRGAEKGKPKVLDRRKQDILEGNVIFGGCWVNASVDVFCYTQNGGGVTTYIRGVQFIREDAPLSGAAANCEADFEDLGDDGSQEQAQDDGGDLPF